MSTSTKTIPLAGVVGFGLGLDAGGTQTRWALAGPGAALVAEGSAGGFSGVQMAQPEGKALLRAVLETILDQARQQMPAGARLCGLCAGITGFDGDGAGPLASLMADVFGVEPAATILYNDIELACRAAFAPGAGYLVYAGTGSVAAFIDDRGQQHRAGGRGGLIDDGGSGYWIAREALRLVWRCEDEAPGAWQRSLLAQRLFERIGGSDWSATRAFVYAASRGQLGELALAVADAAHAGDAQALALLGQAGDELARLARALIGRHGAKPVMLAGRALALHPVIEARIRAGLADVQVQAPAELHAHRRAAEIAAGRA